jgi:hypothetical protein
VWLTISNCDEKVPYSGTISFDPAVAGLSAASFSVSDVKTGEKIEATRTPDGKVQWHMDLPAASIRVLEIKLTRTATPLAAE